MNSKHETRNTKHETAEVLAVVMARGGSVGLPGKALRMLLGRPVLAYTLDHVRESRLVTRSVVSSDDAGVLAVARGEGFEVIERPGELATATSATDPVLRHAVRVLYPAEGGNLTTEDTENTEGENRERKNKEEGIQHSSVSSVVQKSFPRAVVMLYGNVPVRRGGMIDRCIEMLLETGCDSVQTIAPVGKMHPYWMFDLEGEGRIKKHVANDVFRRQDLPALYSPTGAVYAMRTEVLMAAEGSSDPHAFLGKDRRGLVVAAEDSVDLDTEKDLWVAEAMLRSNAETLQKLLRQPEMQNFPAWVVHTLSASPERLFARDGVSLRTTRFDASYLEFLQTQIKLEPRGPEWSAVLRRRHDGLAPFLDTDLMNLSIHAGENNFSLYTHPESLKVLFWETY